MLDFAQVIPEGIDAPSSQAETMGWGMAQRHTHLPASLEATFVPAVGVSQPQRPAASGNGSPRLFSSVEALEIIPNPFFR